jgi:hypothetical protein
MRSDQSSDGVPLGPPLGLEDAQFGAISNIAHVGLKVVLNEDSSLSITVLHKYKKLPAGHASEPNLKALAAQLKEYLTSEGIGHASLPNFKDLAAQLKEYLTNEGIAMSLWPLMTFRLLTGISFEGNTESRMGKGFIYSTGIFNKQDTKPRYDFVRLNCGDSSITLAQVVSFVEIQDKETVRIAAIVLYLDLKQKKKSVVKKSHCEYFAKYVWRIIGYRGKTPIYDVGMVDVWSLMGPAIVIADFSTAVVAGRPSVRDEFFYVSPEWIDRGGYDLDEDELIAQLMASDRGYIRPDPTERQAETVTTDSSKKRKFDIELLDIFDDDKEDGSGEDDYDCLLL